VPELAFEFDKAETFSIATSDSTEKLWMWKSKVSYNLQAKLISGNEWKSHVGDLR
jgi:hypothetical protein